MIDLLRKAEAGAQTVKALRKSHNIAEQTF